MKSIAYLRSATPQSLAPAQHRGRVLRGLVRIMAAVCVLTVNTSPCCGQAEPASELNDEQLALRKGITVEQAQKLQSRGGLDKADILKLSPRKLVKDLWKLDYPMHSFADRAAGFRHARMVDDRRKLNDFARMNVIASLYNENQDAFSQNQMFEYWQWRWLGPNHVGGRTRSILIHPDRPEIMWAASVSGGVWKSVDGGQNWRSLPSLMGNLIVNCLVGHPDEPEILFAGTGEGFFRLHPFHGNGIFLSADGGEHWLRFPSTEVTPENDEFMFVNRLTIVRKQDSSTELVAATNAGLWIASLPHLDTLKVWAKSSDVRPPILDWKSFRTVLTVQPRGGHDDKDPAWLSVVKHPADNGQWVASGRHGKAVYYHPASERQPAQCGYSKGLPQNPKEYRGRVEFAYSVAPPHVIYASVDNNQGGEIYRSTDGGRNYMLVSEVGIFSLGWGWFANSIWAGDPDDPMLLIVGSASLYRSIDGGRSFEIISDGSETSAHFDVHTVVSHASYGAANRKVFVGTDGGIYSASDIRTVTTTSGWQRSNNGYGVTQFYTAHADPKSGRILGGTQDNGTLLYDPDKGESGWKMILGGDGGFCCIDPTDPDVMYGTETHLQINRSLDGGKSARKIASGIIGFVSSERNNFISPMILDPNDSATMLAGGLILWRSINVRDFQPDWHRMKESTGYFISAIAVDPDDSDHVWVGHNDGELYRSQNGTRAQPTWELIPDTSLPTRACTRIVIAPRSSDKVYVTFGGYQPENVWMTSDGGKTWGSLGAKLAPVPVYDLEIDPKEPEHLFVATEVGVFEKASVNADWSYIGPNTCPAEDLAWTRKGAADQLVVATHGRGMFVREVQTQASIVGTTE